MITKQTYINIDYFFNKQYNNKKKDNDGKKKQLCLFI